MTTATSEAVLPRVRWSWLWSPRADLTWNLLPFWISFVVVAVLFGARTLGPADKNPAWNFVIGGRPVHLAAIVMYLYAPLVDAPHLWATIARTYTDRTEWIARRRLFFGSLAWFVVGPVVIFLPYAVRAIVPSVPGGIENAVWLAWSNFFMFYALFHINKQHWGFIALYKRKNSDLADPRENRADSLFFFTAIWLPYAAMLSAPWYTDFDGRPFFLATLPLFATTVGALVHTACHAAFAVVCLGYVLFQGDRWMRGLPRNGPKLVYMATVIPLYYAAFALDPLVAAFWVITTGVGHCFQYHRVVWAYGRSKYAGRQGEDRRLPSTWFESPWLYAALGIAFGVVTLQGPGSGMAKSVAAAMLQRGVFWHMLPGLGASRGLDLGIKMAAAFIGGVRLHHFYVDSKIWRVSRSAALAKNLNV